MQKGLLPANKRARAASENANFAAPDGAAVIILKLRTRGLFMYDIN